MKGTVIKRGKSWRLKFDVDRDASGKRQTRYVTFRGNKKEAESSGPIASCKPR
jgi:hypothetical protein